MIEIKRGDILAAGTEALVNTVNCVGVMGRGIALQFRKAFAVNFEVYRDVCARGELQPGRMLVHDLGRLDNPRWIINFPTKRHWKAKSRIEDIDAGLTALVDVVRERDIHSIAIPPLGCGLGGLDWGEVRPRIETAFRALPKVRVLLYEPAGAPAPENMVKSATPPSLTVGRAVLIDLMRRYLSAVMDPSVTLLEIHKLLYFIQEAGENLRLEFKAGPYGPYAPKLRHVLNAIEGHFIAGYGDAEDRPFKPLKLLPGSWEKAQALLAAHPDSMQRCIRVAALIEGFETPFGMELLATVDWVAREQRDATLEQVIARTYAWNSRKQMCSESQIHTAWDLLQQRGWLSRS